MEYNIIEVLQGSLLNFEAVVKLSTPIPNLNLLFYDGLQDGLKIQVNKENIKAYYSIDNGINYIAFDDDDYSLLFNAELSYENFTLTINSQILQPALIKISFKAIVDNLNNFLNANITFKDTTPRLINTGIFYIKDNNDKIIGEPTTVTLNTLIKEYSPKASEYYIFCSKDKQLNTQFRFNTLDAQYPDTKYIITIDSIDGISPTNLDDIKTYLGNCYKTNFLIPNELTIDSDGNIKISINSNDIYKLTKNTFCNNYIYISIPYKINNNTYNCTDVENIIINGSIELMDKNNKSLAKTDNFGLYMYDTIEVFEGSQITFQCTSQVCNFPDNSTHIRFTDKLSHGLKYIDNSLKILVSVDEKNYSKELIKDKDFTVKYNSIDNILCADIIKNSIKPLKDIKDILYIKVIFKVQIINIKLLDNVLKNTGVFAIVKINDTSVIPLSKDINIHLKYTKIKEYDVSVAGYSLNNCDDDSMFNAKFCFNTLNNQYADSQYILKIDATNNILFSENIKAYINTKNKNVEIPSHQIHSKLNDNGDLEITIDYISEDKTTNTSEEYICVNISYSNSSNYANELPVIYGSMIVKELNTDTIIASLDSLCMCTNFEHCQTDSIC